MDKGPFMCAMHRGWGLEMCIGLRVLNMKQILIGSYCVTSKMECVLKANI